ncbi:MAG: hypothetical protein LBU87_01405 [Lactobacillales bacterium]|jgi:hypothetical protein|nr:hypothetical protein [Lactobacillales bacterium]
MSYDKHDLWCILNREAMDENNTHVLIVCDTFNYETYPVTITKTDNIHAVINKYNKDMQRLEGVYNLKMDIKEQLFEDRPYHIATTVTNRSRPGKTANGYRRTGQPTRAG